MGKLVPIVTTCLVVFEQQILFLEKQAETTDRHGHDGPSRGLVSKYLENLKLCTENRLSELRDGMAGRTVTGMTDRHRAFSENPFYEPCDDLQDGPSQARRAVAGTTGRRRLRNPSLSRISLIILRDVFDYSCFNYIVSGLILVSLITWGLKEVTLS